ncbi:NAD-dependent epimerase/dehydratase family protein [Aquimarina pacifica]|uniref:NAD-dependent epimerase/dehydratase family protein n=1 Tax=Aquimarina pacifica TaxID=1296415 RepID=UPI00047241E9|nr:NAD-dependent epimerase/dehydratase family protein [Aquimarina pacifica]
MILVTGATGLVGTHLLVQLIKEKKNVRALYRTETKKEHAQKVASRYISEENMHLFDAIDWFKTDINDIPLLVEAFEGVTHVYHCAALISFNPKDYKELRKVNIDGTANIVNLCLSNRVKKLCHVSSIAALGENIATSEIDENTEWNPEIPNSVYAITKYGAEMEVWRGIHEGIDAVIVNPGIIIGAGFFDSGSGFLFKRMYAGMKYYTAGVTGYIAIDDVVAIMNQLMNRNTVNERYVLVGENLSFKEAFGLIARALNKQEPKKEVSLLVLKVVYHIQYVSHLIFRTRQSIFRSSLRTAFLHRNYKNDKIKQALDYSFIPVERSIKETATAFLEVH